MAGLGTPKANWAQEKGSDPSEMLRLLLKMDMLSAKAFCVIYYFRLANQTSVL
jgi:hypothetical protein